MLSAFELYPRWVPLSSGVGLGEVSGKGTMLGLLCLPISFFCPRVVTNGRAPGISPGYCEYNHRLLSQGTKEKQNQISLLISYTQQLEILVITALLSCSAMCDCELTVTVHKSRGLSGGGVLPYISHILMCCPRGQGFLHCFGLKTGIDFACYGLESGMIF